MNAQLTPDEAEPYVPTFDGPEPTPWRRDERVVDEWDDPSDESLHYTLFADGRHSVSASVIVDTPVHGNGQNLDGTRSFTGTWHAKEESLPWDLELARRQASVLVYKHAIHTWVIPGICVLALLAAIVTAAWFIWRRHSRRVVSLTLDRRFSTGVLFIGDAPVLLVSANFVKAGDMVTVRQRREGEGGLHKSSESTRTGNAAAAVGCLVLPVLLPTSAFELPPFQSSGEHDAWYTDKEGTLLARLGLRVRTPTLGVVAVTTRSDDAVAGASFVVSYETSARHPASDRVVMSRRRGAEEEAGAGVTQSLPLPRGVGKGVLTFRGVDNDSANEVNFCYVRGDAVGGRVLARCGCNAGV